MPKFFTKRKEPYNLRSWNKNQSTLKSKVDASVECDLPFDESKIAPELRHGPVTKKITSSELLEPSHKNSVGFNKTNLEPVDISVDSDSDDNLSALDQRRLRAIVESEEELYSENEREKEKEKTKENCTDNIFATGIRLDVSTARTQLINNLAGPAETFMFELPPDEGGNYNALKQALVKRYSTKDRAWVKQHHSAARCQGPNELLSDYINDMHELFSGLNMAEVDKVT
ncbi:unnamed protein product [Porites evermanni]|uniref:Uncharacterized protein n=1 Tax=Porites evermanni TaxID=104178 RepID=A0ABN8LM21_9CNID|nr:unnamed protein product [Porites evermanni]